jgi:hypothetical protein
VCDGVAQRVLGVAERIKLVAQREPYSAHRVISVAQRMTPSSDGNVHRSVGDIVDGLSKLTH